MTDSLVMWGSGDVDIYAASCGIRGTLPWDKTELAALPPKIKQFIIILRIRWPDTSASRLSLVVRRVFMRALPIYEW